ncbi:MAG: ABC transporter ATP-binding protein [bacterium]
MNWNDKHQGGTLRFFTTGLSTLWHLLGQEQKKIIWLFVLMFGLTILDLLFPFSLKLIFDQLPTIVRQPTLPNSLFGLVALLLLVKIVTLFIHRLVKEYYFLMSLIRLENWWPVLAQEKLLELSLSFHERENTGKKISKITKGCDKLVQILADLHWALLPQLLYLVINIGIVLALDPILGILFLSPFPVVVLIMIRMQNRCLPIWEQWEIQKERANGLFCQSIISVQTVQSFVQERREREAMGDVRKDMEKLDKKDMVIANRYYLAMGLILEVMFAITIIVGIYRLTINSVTIGTIVYIIATGNASMQSLWAVMNTYRQIVRNLMAVIRMKQLLDEPVEIIDKPDSVIPTGYHECVSFQNVGFTYPKTNHPVLMDINLDLTPGQMAAFVGRSGAGKTTLVRLLTRSYDATSGSIALDDVDIKDIKKTYYRRLFAVVKQDVDVFDATIEYNITYGSQAVSGEEIKKALLAAHLENVITDHKRFPAGLETQVGEQGIQLSGGERQRVGIARAYLALLKGAKILVLDEATSHLDSETEKTIQTMITAIRQAMNISIVVIAHRLSTINQADMIYVLDNGIIAEQGNHDDLMRHNGLYAKLVELQQIGDIRE